VYTGKMIASFVVITSSWHSCVPYAWEIKI